MRDHVRAIDACKGLIIRIFQFAGRAHGERSFGRPDEVSQGFANLHRQHRGDKLREYLFVRQVCVDHVLQPVVMDELIKIIGSDDHGTRHKDADIVPMVEQVMFLQDMVQESESASFAAHRAVPASREINRAVICLGSIARHDTQGLIDTVVVYEPDIGLPDVLYIRFVLDGQFVHFVPDREQATCEQPFGEVVVVTQPSESGGGDGGNDAFESLEVGSPRNLFAGTRVARDEIAETELPLDIFADLLRQGLRLFDDESHFEPVGSCPHGLLGTLHKNRHGGVVLAYEPAQIHTRVQFLRFRKVAFVDYKSDVADDADDVLAETLV